MTAFVEFFASADEERAVLEHLLHGTEAKVFDGRERRFAPWDDFATDRLPAWSEPLSIYLWQPAHGPLAWHTSQPTIEGATHGSFVANFLAHEAWTERGMTAPDRLLNVDLSPVVQYRRGTIRDGRRNPHYLVARPSSLARVGAEYERWVKRNLAWIRRRGQLIHDWRKQAPTIPNRDRLLTPTYAWPDALKQLESPEHNFAFFVNED